jgi:hypothetical protein
MATSRLLSWSTGPFPGVPLMVGVARRERQANFRPERAPGAAGYLRCRAKNRAAASSSNCGTPV